MLVVGEKQEEGRLPSAPNQPQATKCANAEVKIVLSGYFVSPISFQYDDLLFQNNKRCPHFQHNLKQNMLILLSLTWDTHNCRVFPLAHHSHLFQDDTFLPWHNHASGRKKGVFYEHYYFSKRPFATCFLFSKDAIFSFLLVLFYVM